MSTDVSPTSAQAIPCCPEFGTDCPCDVLDFHYRLTHHATVRAGGRTKVVPVEVKIHARLERCPGDLAMGELVYSTTLLPGEKVRLFTSDRRTRFTFDSASRVSYRHEQLSEERFYMASLHDFMSDVTVRDERSASSQSQGSWSFDSGASGWFVGIAGGASVHARGRTLAGLLSVGVSLDLRRPGLCLERFLPAQLGVVGIRRVDRWPGHLNRRPRGVMGIVELGDAVCAVYYDGAATLGAGMSSWVSDSSRHSPRPRGLARKPASWRTLCEYESAVEIMAAVAVSVA